MVRIANPPKILIFWSDQEADLTHAVQLLNIRARGRGEDERTGPPLSAVACNNRLSVT